MEPEAQLVLDDLDRHVFRVHRSAMTSSDIFEAERHAIFGTNWLYVGHESEVAMPGDYVRRKVAGRSMFLVRGVKSGAIRVFHNSCTHRGATVCRQDAGNTKVFQCFYHAWSFNTEGVLVGVPDEDAYGQGFSRDDLGLRSPPRVESYRGFVFISFDPGVEELIGYLAGAPGLP